MKKMKLITALLVFLQPVLVSAAQTPERTEGSQGGEQSRAEELRTLRQEKLDNVEPAKASRAAKILATAENDGFDQLVTVQARHWRFGFGKISPVSSFTPAIQYERPRLGGSELTLRTSGAYSVRGYQAYDFRLGRFEEPAPYAFLGQGFLGAPFEFDRRTQERPEGFLYADLHYRNFPREEFFGLGPDSVESARTDYKLEEGAFDMVAVETPMISAMRLRVTFFLLVIVTFDSRDNANL